MKALVIGATGTIGKAVVAALTPRYEVIGASRKSGEQVDLADRASIERLLDRVGPVDAVVSAAGEARFKALSAVTDEDLDFSIRSKLLGQVNLARLALPRIREGGSLTLTSGILSHHPMPGSSVLSMVNAGLEGFTRAAALEAPAHGMTVATASARPAAPAQSSATAKSLTAKAPAVLFAAPAGSVALTPAAADASASSSGPGRRARR